MEQSIKTLGLKCDDTVRYVNDAVQKLEFTTDRMFKDLTRSMKKLYKAFMRLKPNNQQIELLYSFKLNSYKSNSLIMSVINFM